MRAALRVPLVLAVIRLLVAPAAVGQQQGRLPWRAGDAPPAVAGLSLGAARSSIDSALGKPASVRSVGPGVQLLGYGSRGVAVLYSDADSLTAVYLLSREAGDVGGVRVGDSGDSVRARWGSPTGVEEGVAVYQVGRWIIVVRADSARGRVGLLGVGRATEAEAEGPYDSTANARQDIAAALQQSRTDHKLVLIDFGANWCLDCLVLERLFGDSTVAGYLGAHFRVVRVDVGRFDRNLEISSTYGSPIEGGVPAVVVLSPAGDVVASTKDGSLESARSATAARILQFLQSWVAAARR